MLASAREFSYEGAKDVVPQFWQEHYQAGKGKVVMGVYGINIDLNMGHDTFEYLIADPYNPVKGSSRRIYSENDSRIYMGGISLQRCYAICIAGCKHKDFYRMASSA